MSTLQEGEYASVAPISEFHCHLIGEAFTGCLVEQHNLLSKLMTRYFEKEVTAASCVVMEALFLVRLKDNLSEVLTCGQHTVPC